MYNILHQQEKKPIHGGIALIAIVAVVVGLAMLLNRQPTPVRTQDSSALERVNITNVRDRSVTIYWRTPQETQGYIVYGLEPGSLSMKAYDKKDSAKTMNPRRNHVVDIPSLTPESQLYFRVVVDGEFVGQTAEIPFSVQTSRTLSSPLDLEPIYGTIERQSGQKEKDAVVIAQIGSAKPLLTRTTTDGTFLLSPCCLYDNESGEPVYPAETDLVRLEMIAEDGTSKIVQIDLGNVMPFQTALVIDGDSDLFTQRQQSTDDEQEPDVLAASDSVIQLDPVDIIFPQEGAAIPGTRPLVKGVGEPGEEIQGRFEEANRIFRVRVDNDRNWEYSPSFDFSPGSHTFEMKTRDDRGAEVVLSRSFTILKSGQAVLGEATPSGTITPTISVTPDPTSTPSPTTVVDATATPTPPVSGVNIMPIALISLVLIVIGGGIILLF